MIGVPLGVLRGVRRGAVYPLGRQNDALSEPYAFSACVSDAKTGEDIVRMIRECGRNVFGALYSMRRKGQPRVVVSGSDLGRLETLAWLIGDGLITSDKIKKALTVH